MQSAAQHISQTTNIITLNYTVMFKLDTNTHSFCSNKNYPQLTPKKKCLLTYSIFTALFSPTLMAQESKEKPKHYFSLQDGDKQYLNEDQVIPALEDLEFRVPVNPLDIEATGLSVKDYIASLRSERQPPATKSPAAFPEPISDSDGASLPGNEKKTDSSSPRLSGTKPKASPAAINKPEAKAAVGDSNVKEVRDSNASRK